MADLKAKTIVIYGSWLEYADRIGGKEKQDELVMALVRYAFYGDVPEYKNGSAEDVFFGMAVPLIDADKKKRNGGAPKGNKNASKTTCKNNLQKQPKNNPLNNTIEQRSKQTTYTYTYTPTYTDTYIPPSSPPLEGGGGQAEDGCKTTAEQHRQYPAEWDEE